MKTILRLVFSVLICQGAGALGAVFTGPVTRSQWYLELQKPVFQPPGWLFAPVWITLYLMMGLALFLLWQNTSKPFGHKAWGLFFIQLVLNVLWSVFFFGLNSPGLALVEIVILWAAILLTLVSLRGVSRTASWLMVPYLAWVSFAAVLNAAIWWLNRI